MRLDDLEAVLQQPLQSPDAVLDTLVMGVAKGQPRPELWPQFHEAVMRDDLLAELAFAYENLSQDKRVKLLPPEQQAELLMHAVTFFADFFGDPDGAIAHAEQVLGVVPGHPDAFGVLERLLTEAGQNAKLAQLYVDAAGSERDRDQQLMLLSRAAELVENAKGADELAIDICQRILRIEPGAIATRAALEARYMALGRPKDAARVLEQALLREPPPDEAEALPVHVRLMELFTGVLKEPQRATPHVEALLAAQPDNEAAQKVAEILLENKPVAPRAAAALSDAYQKLGRIDDAAAMLEKELGLVRGPRRMDVQRRLAILREDHFDDAAGALQLLGPVVAGDPGDDNVRKRYVRLSLALGKPQDAARLLQRALSSCRDPAVRARVGAEIGNVFVESGDVKRAQAAFQQVVESAQDDSAVLEAARRLVDLHAQAGAQKAQLAALELVVKLEPEPEARQAAARSLAELCEKSDPPDVARAISAWRALLDSPWADKALARLEELCEQNDDPEALIDVLERRAQRAKDPEQARELVFRAADLRSTRTRDRRAALSAWRALIATYGPARDAHARMLPLLEQEHQWQELAWLLEREIELSPNEERPGLYSRLAQIKLSRLEDTAGALSAFREALSADPAERGSRLAVEKLLGSGEVRLEAADILEPLYRAEEAATGLVKVLETRSELADSPDQRLAALEEAVRTADGSLGDPERALSLATTGLKAAVREQRSALGTWLVHVQEIGGRVGNPALRANGLAEALGDLPVDSPEMLSLARAAGDALVTSGDVAQAVEIFRRALAFEPGSPELLGRVDELLAQQGSPEERLTLYRSALERTEDPARRRELLHSMASLQRRDLNDLESSIETWKLALLDDARDWTAHLALVDAYQEVGDHKRLFRELERVLPHAEGERRNATLLRLAVARAAHGEPEQALSHYRELMQSGELDDAVLGAIEELSSAQNDAPTLAAVLERRVAGTTVPEEQAALLERLGEVQAGGVLDPEAAARSFLAGARLGEGSAGDEALARRLYRRVLELAPGQREAAERLFELDARAGDWQRLPDSFRVLLSTSEDPRQPMALLVSLETQAVDAGAADVFIALVDAAVEFVGDHPALARPLLLARARVLALDPDRHDQAAAIYRQVIESAGDEAGAAAEAFDAFLQSGEATPARLQDRRWLFQWRTEHADDPASVLFAWAVAEENLLGSPEAAVELYRRVLELDPERTEALGEMARLQAMHGDPEGALASMRELSTRSEPEARPGVDLAIAGMLLDLERSGEALDVLQQMIEATPGDADVLRLVQRALDDEDARARAAELLERAAASAGDVEARAAVLKNLLDVSRDNSGLDEARGRWLEQLLECYADDPETSLTIALGGAEERPMDAALWDIAERMTRQLDRPQPLAEAYARALDASLSPEDVEALGQRMIEFHEEWFDEPERVVRLLERVLERSPAAGWAFDRLKLSFNAAGRWPELFNLYDRALEHTEDEAARIELLREASMAAKDFAADPDRAILYLEQLNRAAPGDARIESSLERLYEREGRLQPLIELLSQRLPGLEGSELADQRARIASLWLDLGEALPAFELLEALLDDASDGAGGYELLERLVALPASRDTMTPSSGGRRRKRNFTVRDRAARRLKNHYEAEGRTADMARMLEIELEAANDDKTRIKGLEEIVRLRLDTLDDPQGAFDAMSSLVAIKPASPEYRQRLAELAERTGSAARRAGLLVAVARRSDDAALGFGLLSEAATVYRELGESSAAIDLFAEVLSPENEDNDLALEAARALDKLLEDSGRAPERCDVLERRVDLESDPDARRRALGEAARVAAAELGDPGRAVRNWQRRLEDDAGDREALDGLVDALAQAGSWRDLIVALEQRAELGGDSAEVRVDRVRIARTLAERLTDNAAAIEVWRRVRSEHGRDAESFDALVALLEAEQRWTELATLLGEEAGATDDAEARSALLRQLGELHRSRTGDAGAALKAFVAAGQWPLAVEVAASDAARSEDHQVLHDLLELSIEAWQRDADDSGAARAASWGLDVLSSRLTTEGKHQDVVELYLRGAGLPFETERRRELKRDAAVLCAERLGDRARAIELFQQLFAEDPADSVASGAVGGLAALLEQEDRQGELAALWEEQARCRAQAGENTVGAELWARAATICRDRLDDEERAAEDFRQGAGLGGEASLEALARIHEARGEHRRAAEVLEWLVAQSSPDALAPRALELAEAYASAGLRKRARARLEQALERAVDPAALRQRLGVLYREVSDWEALAGLLVTEAESAPAPAAKLALLREAANLHLEKREDPAAAVPLLEQAAALDPEDASLPLALSDALAQAGRFDEASAILRARIERYGSRRPKDRALVHFALARVALAAGQREEALAELGAANRIDQAHAGILHALARLAFEEGELERAERMYRALLLVLGRGANAEGPSRAEALLDLSEIAAQKDDPVRAGEFVESALEAALESDHEARRLEQALRRRGRQELLTRALEARLAGNLEPADAARVLADLVVLHAENAAAEAPRQSGIRNRAQGIQNKLEAANNPDDAAWAALGRVYDWLGDRDAEAQVLERRVAAWQDGETPSDAEPLYRLAEVRLGDPDTCEEGLGLLDRGLELAPDPDRAESLLRPVLDAPDAPERALALLERIGRMEGREATLAEALARIARASARRPDVLHEAVALSERVGDPGLAETVLQAALDNDMELQDADAAWLRLELARLHALGGRRGQALELRELAASFLPTDERRALMLDVAREAREGLDDLERAARIYEELLLREPADGEVWRPLLDVQRRLGHRDRVIQLIEQTAPLVESIEDRSKLRTEQATLLIEGDEQLDEAEQILKEVLEDNPADESAGPLLASILEKSGRLDELVLLLVTQVDAAKDRQDVDAIEKLSLRLGGLLEEQDRSDDALDVYRAMLDWNAQSRPALTAVLRLADAKGDEFSIGEALEGLLQVERGEQAKALLERLITLRADQGDEEGQERALELGAIACPEDEELRQQLVTRYRERGDSGGLARVLRQAVERGATDLATITELVEAHRAAGEPEPALELIERLVDEEAPEPALLAGRAALLGELGRDDEALAELERAHAVDGGYTDRLIEALERAVARAEPPRDQELTLRLVEVLEAAGEIDGARARLGELIRETPGNVEALRRLAVLETTAEEWSAAADAYNQLVAVEQGADLVDAALRLADACQRAGRFNDARAGLEHALTVAPDNELVREWIAALYESTGAHRELAQMLLDQAAAETEPERRVQLLLDAGQLLLAPDGDPGLGAQVLEEARTLAPGNIASAVLLARAYALNGRSADAMALLEEVVSAQRGRRVKELSDVYREMSWIQTEEGFLSDALASLTRAFEMDPRNGPVAIQLGQLALDVDDDDIAMRAFRAVTMMRPTGDNPSEGATSEAKAEAHYQLGRLSMKQGDPRKAKILVSKALTENPDHELARTLYEQLGGG